MLARCDRMADELPKARIVRDELPPPKPSEESRFEAELVAMRDAARRREIWVATMAAIVFVAAALVVGGVGAGAAGASDSSDRMFDIAIALGMAAMLLLAGGLALRLAYHRRRS
jgi:hypothetical protein